VAVLKENCHKVKDKTAGKEKEKKGHLFSNIVEEKD